MTLGEEFSLSSPFLGTPLYCLQDLLVAADCHKLRLTASYSGRTAAGKIDRYSLTRLPVFTIELGNGVLERTEVESQRFYGDCTSST